jgi:hypothetical protein
MNITATALNIGTGKNHSVMDMAKAVEKGAQESEPISPFSERLSNVLSAIGKKQIYRIRTS